MALPSGFPTRTLAPLSLDWERGVGVEEKVYQFETTSLLKNLEKKEIYLRKVKNLPFEMMKALYFLKGGVMKKKINFLKKKALELIQDESGQGTTEYILMLVAAVAVALVFKSQLGDKMKTHWG